MNNLTRTLPLAVLLAAGCGPRLQAPADPAQARDALRTALDAWQRGDRPDALRAASPAVHVNDPDWSAGHRLTRYQIAAGGDRAGTDLRYPVRLTFTGPKGQTVQKNTAYMVGTSPVLTVVRHDPGS
jgi:hypothetical protein